MFHKSLCILALLSFSPVDMASAMTHEEKVVRTTYARLVYAVDLNNLYSFVNNEAPSDAASAMSRADLNRHMADAVLQIELQDFKVGDVSEIAQVKYRDLVSKPSGEDVLSVGVAHFSHAADGEFTKMDTATMAVWGPGQTVTEDWNIPMDQALPIIAKQNGNASYFRFAAFAVTATFKGRSRTYKALFLFGRKPNGEDDIRVGDTVIGINGGALEHFATHTIYPTLFLETGMREKPLVREWFTSRQHFDQSCKSGARDVCCDLTTLQCGVLSEDLLNSLARPIGKQNENCGGPPPSMLRFHLEGCPIQSLPGWGFSP